MATNQKQKGNNESNVWNGRYKVQSVPFCSEPTSVVTEEVSYLSIAPRIKITKATNTKKGIGCFDYRLTTGERRSDKLVESSIEITEALYLKLLSLSDYPPMHVVITYVNTGKVNKLFFESLSPGEIYANIINAEQGDKVSGGAIQYVYENNLKDVTSSGANSMAEIWRAACRRVDKGEEAKQREQQLKGGKH